MNDNPKKNENPRNLMQKIARSPLIYVAVVLVIFVLAGVLASPGRTVVKEIGYSEFLNLLDEGKIKSVDYNDRPAGHKKSEQLLDTFDPLLVGGGGDAFFYKFKAFPPV